MERLAPCGAVRRRVPRPSPRRRVGGPLSSWPLRPTAADHEPRPRYRTGSRPGRRERRPALPAAAARGRARARKHRARLRRHELLVPGDARWLALCSRWRWPPTCVERRRPGAASSRQLELALGLIGVVLGALLFAGSLADTGHASWPGLVGGAACALLGFAAVAGLLRRTRRRLDDSAASFLTAYADVHRAGARRRSRSSSRRSAFVALAGFVLLLISGQRAGGREVRGPAHPALAGRAAEEARPRRHRLAQARDARPRDRGGPRAGARRRSCERGTYVRDCVSSFPSVTPVAVAAIATGLGPGPTPHPVDELVPPRRAALRRVRLLVPGHARLRRPPLALRHGLQHEHGPPQPGARRRSSSTLDDAGLRTACTTFLIYRGRTRHEPAEERRLPARSRRAAQFRHAVYGPARAVLRGPVRTRARPAARSTLGMPGQRDQHTGCVGAYLVEHDLFDFMLFSLPDNDTYSHKAGPVRRRSARSRRPTARSSGIMHVAGGAGRVPRRPRGDRHVGPLADQRRGRGSTSPRPSPTGACSRPRTRRRREAELAVSPAARSAHGLRARREPPRRAGAAGGGDAARARGRGPRRDPGAGRRAVRCRDAGELRFAPGGELDRSRAASSWSVEGDHAALC